MSLYHEEFEGAEYEKHVEEYQTGQRRIKRQAYHSIPLRRQAKGNPGQARTTGSYAAMPDVQTMQTQAPKSLVSRAQMPVKPDAYNPKPAHSNAIRYTDSQGRQIIQQGNKRILLEQGKPKRRFHWVLFVGLGMMAALLLWQGVLWVITGVQAHNVDGTYGYPRTFQMDEVVGHSDSASHPSHFIFENLHGRVVIIEIPGGDIAKSIIYGGPTLFTPQADQLPVTGKFEDVNGDGKVDMLVTVNDQTITFLNNGTKFVPQS